MSGDLDFESCEIAEVFYTPEYTNVPNQADDEGTIFGSRLPNGMHLPIFDLDFECRLIPSRTTGHSHLYLNKPISAIAYRKILIALTEAGLLQSRWAQRIEEEGQVFLRLPAAPQWLPSSRYLDPELETKS